MKHPRPTLLSLLPAGALMQACGEGGDGEAPAPTQSPRPIPAPPPVPGPAPAPSPTPAATAVGAVLGPVVASVGIGTQGGRLDAPDYGLAVVVPAGAFDDSEQLVTLQPIENKAQGAGGCASPPRGWMRGSTAAGAARRARSPGMDRSRQPPRVFRRVGRGMAALVADATMKGRAP